MFGVHFPWVYLVELGFLDMSPEAYPVNSLSFSFFFSKMGMIMGIQNLKGFLRHKKDSICTVLTQLPWVIVIILLFLFILLLYHHHHHLIHRNLKSHVWPSVERSAILCILLCIFLDHYQLGVVLSELRAPLEKSKTV